MIDDQVAFPTLDDSDIAAIEALGDRLSASVGDPVLSLLKRRRSEDLNPAVSLSRRSHTGEVDGSQ